MIAPSYHECRCRAPYISATQSYTDGDRCDCGGIVPMFPPRFKMYVNESPATTTPIERKLGRLRKWLEPYRDTAVAAPAFED